MHSQTLISILLSPTLLLLTQQALNPRSTPNEPTDKDKFLYPPPCPSIQDYSEWNNTNKAHYREGDVVQVQWLSNVTRTRLEYWCCKNLGFNFGECIIRPRFNQTSNRLYISNFTIPKRNDDRDICYLHLDQPQRKTGIDTQEFVIVNSTDEPVLYTIDGDKPILDDD